MRAVSITLFAVLLTACAPTGEEIAMTPPERSEHVADATTEPSPETTADAAAVATRELQTATFALG